MAIQIDITLEPINIEAPAWAPLEERFDFYQVYPEERNYESAAWQDVVEEFDLAPALESINIEAPAWSDALESDFEALQVPDPGSDPYVLEDELDPLPSATGVAVTKTAFIPVGDAISTLEESTRVDPLDLTNPSPIPIGINPLLTTILVQYDSDPPITVLSGGVITPGWSVSVVTNDQAGPNRAIAGVGRNYSVKPTTNWPFEVTVTVTLELVDYANNDYLYTYSFETEEAPIPPYLVEEPQSPNGNITQLPMRWQSASDDVLAADISQLVVGGRVAVLNNVVQAGFTGTVTFVAGTNGYLVSIVADVDYWQADYYLPWSITLNNGGPPVTFTGTIIKYVTLPYPSKEPQPPYTLRAIDFPLQFTGNGDVRLTSDEMSIEHGLRMSVMIVRGGIPLATHLGSLVPLMPFDPNDPTTSALIAEEIIRSTKMGEPRARVDSSVVTEESESTVRAIVPYSFRGFSNWESLRLSIPLQNLDKGK